MPGDGGASGWQPDRVISPTALKTFAACPHRVRLRYIDQVDEPRTFDVNLSKGRITHDFLAVAARRIAKGELEFGREWCFTQALRRLPPHEFPSALAREAHARDIADWVTWGLDHLDRSATILRIEKGERRAILGQDRHVALKVYTRPDLVLLGRTSDGAPLVEFVDYKTGKPKEDHLVPVLMRYVFKDFLAQHVPSTRDTRMRFTWYWLEAREVTHQDLDLDYAHEKLEEARLAIDQLLAERNWAPRPSYLCHWCPYRGNPCSAYARAMNDIEREDGSGADLRVADDPRY